jgi:eukaryotic-like serine/threonine-protein kinase
VVHAALMKIPPELFAQVANRSKSLARTLVKAFARHAKSQGWPFSYTDSIADVCKGLFDELTDTEMRADLLAAVLVVGHWHNRFYVMGVAAKLIEAAKEPNDVAAFAKILKDHPEETASVQGYIDRSEVHAGLKHFLRKRD